MSMITELVERLRKNSASLEITFSIAENLREAADVIEELSAKLQAANMERSSQYYNVGWIPVSERLPEEREWYLAVFKEIDTGYQLIPRVADYIGNGENEWQIIDEDGLGQEYRSILECVAWMPLPKSYEPQESEKRYGSVFR